MDSYLLNFVFNYRYNKTPAQILIRWGVQHGYITIPKSSRPQRVEENSKVFNWSLKDEDIESMVSTTDQNAKAITLCRVPTAQGKQGKWPKRNPCQEKHREFGNFAKARGKHMEFGLLNL